MHKLTPKSGASIFLALQIIQFVLDLSPSLCNRLSVPPLRFRRALVHAEIARSESPSYRQRIGRACVCLRRRKEVRKTSSSADFKLQRSKTLLIGF